MPFRDATVFISYAVEDREVADAACSVLEAAGMRCWMAPRDVRPGAAYAACIVEAIAASKALVLVLSPHSSRSPHVLRELERAVSRDLPILPLRIAEFPLPPEMEYFVSSRHWLDALTLPLEPHLARLLYGVRAVLEGAPPPAQGQGARANETTDVPSAWALKYYVYISDAKVDMLLGQLPAAPRGALAARLGLSAESLGSLAGHVPRDLGARVARLHAAVDALRSGGCIGTVDEALEYFEGTLSMSWGPYGHRRDADGLVFFSAATELTHVGLGGSMRHVLGDTGWTDAHSHSIAHVLVATLQAELDEGLDPASTGAWRFGVHTALQAVDTAVCNPHGPEQRLEFVAKRLLAGPAPSGKPWNVLLGTPLYVALAE